MNYRHAYHAGGFTDVTKHTVLALVIAALKKKDSPFFVLDTHAGIGRYDLSAAEAVKTGEASNGVLRLVGKVLPFELGAYWGAVKTFNKGQPGGALRWYPGSPRLVKMLLRPQDRMVLAELHPDDAKSLADEFGGDPQVRVQATDGYAALKALLPPPERRGLALIDPPFEIKDEFALLQRGLADAWKRWATGTYVVWYPIKDVAPVRAFHDWVRKNAPAEALAAEVYVHPPVQADRLNGCGLLVVNPPWKLDEQLANVLPFLHETLALTKGSSALTWLVREKDLAERE